MGKKPNEEKGGNSEARDNRHLDVFLAPAGKDRTRTFLVIPGDSWRFLEIPGYSRSASP
jgi:hypothetical protein